MENYPSNSHKSKEIEKTPEKKVEKIITSEVKTKKQSGFKRFADSFINSDISDVKSYLLTDVFLPALKSTVSDMVSNGIDMLLYGESRHSSRSGSSGNKVNYTSYSYKGTRNASQKNERPIVKERYNYDDVILGTRGEAEDVLGHLQDICEEYGMVSIADLYDLVGLPTSWSDNKYGWYNLAGSRVERINEGFLISLPRTVALD